MFNNLLQISKTRAYPRKLRTVLQRLEKYSKPIKNSFYYTLSNGPVEGINNRIKNIKRSGYGYRNFMNLRYRALISFKFKNKEKEPKEIFYHELMVS